MSTNSSKQYQRYSKNNSHSRLDTLEMSQNPNNTSSPIGVRNQPPRANLRSSSSDHDEGLLDDRFAPGTIDGDTQVNEMSTPNNIQNFPTRTNYNNSNNILQSNQHSSPTRDAVNSYNDDICGQAEDFHTIDWLREASRSRVRHRHIHKITSDAGLQSTLPHGNSFYLPNLAWRSRVAELWDASSGWLCVILIGIASGFFAGIINIASESLNDVKLGICTTGIYLNEEECCWSSTHETKNCTDFKEWGEVLFKVEHNSKINTIVTFIFYNIWGILFAVTAALLVKYFAPYACGSGIPEVKTILSGFVIHGYMGKWTLIIKSLALPLAVGAGLCLGKEGPMVHIASCCGNFFAKKFSKYHNEAKRREILSAACAAGVSVAFGAPIGGVLFSLEEASYYFPLKTLWRSFLCAMIAAITLAGFNPYGSGKLVMFPVNHSVPWTTYEVLFFAILGAMGGAYGAFFVKLNVVWCKLRKTAKFGQYPIEEIAFLGFVTCAFSFPFSYGKMSMPHLIKLMFSSCSNANMAERDICAYEIQNANLTSDGDLKSPGPMSHQMVNSIFVLLYVAVVKGMLTIFTFGTKIPCGLFIPTLAVGSIVGRVFGMLIEQATLKHPTFFLWESACSQAATCAVPGVYAMVGAAAFLGGVTRMTVSLVVIMYELTGSLNYIVPFMIASMVSKWVGDAFNDKGIYDGHIQLNGYPFLDNKEDFHDTAYAVDIMRPGQLNKNELVVITSEGMTVRQLEQLAKETTYHGFPIVVSHDSHRLVGFVTRRELLLALHSARMSDVEVLGTTRVSFIKRGVGSTNLSASAFSNDSGESVSPMDSKVIRLNEIIDLHPITITIHMPVEIVVEMFKKLGCRQILTMHHGKLLGIITKKDVLRHIAKMQGNTSPILFN